MSDVYVEAHRKVSADDLGRLVTYNALVRLDIEPPVKLVTLLRLTLGYDSRLGFPCEEIDMPTGEMISVSVQGEGDVEYGDGMTIKIADLPPGTVALRIYMS